MCNTCGCKSAEDFEAEFKGNEGVWLYRYPLSYRPNEQAITVFKDKEDWLPIWEKLCEDYIQIRNRESLEVFERQMQEKREDFPHLSDNELEEQFPTSFAYWKRQTIQIPQAIDDMVVRLNQEGDERGVYSIDLGKKRYNPSGYHINNAHTITYNDYHAFVFYPFGDNEYYDAEEFEATKGMDTYAQPLEELKIKPTKTKVGILLATVVAGGLWYSNKMKEE